MIQGRPTVKDIHDRKGEIPIPDQLWTCYDSEDS
jgi:hypothetical protein